MSSPRFLIRRLRMGSFWQKRTALVATLSDGHRSHFISDGFVSSDYTKLRISHAFRYRWRRRHMTSSPNHVRHRRDRVELSLSEWRGRWCRHSKRFRFRSQVDDRWVIRRVRNGFERCPVFVVSRHWSFRFLHDIVFFHKTRVVFSVTRDMPTQIVIVIARPVTSTVGDAADLMVVRFDRESDVGLSLDG